MLKEKGTIVIYHTFCLHFIYYLFSILMGVSLPLLLLDCPYVYRYLDAAAIRRTMGSGASEQEVEDMLGRDMVYDLW